MPQTAKGTNYSIEFMRIAGVILITFTHIKHNYTAGIPYFILETLPKYGTLILSVISGYLFYSYRNSDNLLSKKIKSLLVPYLIANLLVVVPVVCLYLLGYNYLGRLDYNYKLITDGILGIDNVPVNPPTYFIRDLFVVFCIIALFKKDLRGLVVIAVFFVFGSVLLRPFIAYLFAAGYLIKQFSVDEDNKRYANIIGIPLLIASFFFFTDRELYRYLIALLLFINIVGLKFKFVHTGAFTYMLHLYHAPVIVFLYPLLHLLHLPPWAEALLQIALAIALCSVLFGIVKKLKLGFVVGNRL
ncbi:hypothetical protein FMM05_19920 [Flavobacterium zepuense]|uniref:Acyltransferase 3 domain-containing protein n=1 Tax=Flavobacterium zepuense TaxID=2593302 RepID=A0A552UTG8_9FLAO|nr:acyltransferase family protein [Flavobacterium zepuense]TRW21526.1 hypothetical protein FMM05_19920 [Flavobacterium zepuense]